MAYEKNTWVNGDTITAEKLNHMEDGIAEGGGSSSGPLIVNLSYTESEHSFDTIMDKTWQEIHDAFPNVIVLEIQEGPGFNLTWLYTIASINVETNNDDTTYRVEVNGIYPFVTTSANGYPTYKDSK